MHKPPASSGTIWMKLQEDSRKVLRDIEGNPLLALLIFIALAGITAVGFLPTYRGNHFDAGKLGEFGDFVGGYFGPILSLTGLFFVILTLREQRATTLAEREGEEVQAFENRFYQLLRLHRDNVAEMRFSPTSTGRKVFVTILNELQVAMRQVRKRNAENGIGLDFQHQLQLAYYFVFFGVGDNSSPQLRGALTAIDADVDDPFFQALELDFIHHRNYPHDNAFKGQQLRLGHYYRHLYHTVSYVNSQPDTIDKLSYMKMIRAQLSTQEQALLLANSLTGLGWDWWTMDYIEIYGLVKNLPKGFVESYYYLDAEALFTSPYFEWQGSKGLPKVFEKLKEVEDDTEAYFK